MSAAEKPRRILGYARVSSKEQAFGQSLHEQQASCTAYAEARGLKVERFFVEAESGARKKIEHREQMRLLLREARRGDLVLVDKLDRWSRDPEFTYKSVRELLERGANIYFVSEGVDPSTSLGDSELNFRILFAREDHKRIRERTLGTRAKIRERGYFTEGHWPFGYRKGEPKTHRDLERHVLVVVPEEAETVRTVFQRIARGHRLADIATDLGWVHQRVLRMVHNRHYLGEMRLRKGGEWVKAKHEAIVSASLFERAREVVTGRNSFPARSSTPSRTDDWLIKDIARCGRCGEAMISAYGHGVGGKYTYLYYMCFRRCAKGYVPVRAAEARVVELVAARLIELRDALAKGPEPVKLAAKVDFASRRAAIEKRRAKHIEAHANEIITLGDLRAQLAKLDVERQKLDAAESSSGAHERTRDPVVRREMLRDVASLESRWRGADERTKREVINQLAKQVRIAKVAVDQVTIEPAWRTLEELAEDLGR